MLFYGQITSKKIQGTKKQGTAQGEIKKNTFVYLSGDMVYPLNNIFFNYKPNALALQSSQKGSTIQVLVP